MKRRLVTTVAIRNNPTSVPPLGLMMTKKSKLFRAVAIAGLFLVGTGGAGGYSYAASGLPSGLSLNTATGEITGTPAALGHTVISATVTDSETNTYSASFTLDVISAMNFEQTAPPDAERNTSYSYQFNVTGATGAVTYAVTSGSVMAGTSLSSGGLLDGVVTTPSGTRVTFTVTATDGGTGETLDIPCSVSVFGELKAAISSARPTITVNVPTTIDRGTIGYLGGEPSYLLSLHTGSVLPAGLSMTVNPGDGSITFKATQAFASTFLKFDVLDGLGFTTPTSGMFLTAVDPNRRVTMRDGSGDLGDPDPESIRIHSSDGSVDVSGTNVDGVVVYDLSAASSGGGGGGGSNLFFRSDEFTAVTGDDQFLLDQTPYSSASSTVMVFVDGLRLASSALLFSLPYVQLYTPLSGGEEVAFSYWSTANPSATTLTNSSSHDIYFSDVVSLVHFDGTNGATSAADQIAGRTWSLGGTSALSTTSPKFGSASAHFAASGGCTPSAAPTVGNSNVDFTIECWTKPNASSGSYWAVFAHASSRGLFVHNNHLELWIGGALVVTAATAMSGGWDHVALTRSSGVMELWLNGVSQGTVADTSVWIDSYIGTDNSSETMAGYIDDFRMTDNVARYTTTFTPPTFAFPNS